MALFPIQMIDLLQKSWGRHTEIVGPIEIMGPIEMRVFVMKKCFETQRPQRSQ